MVLTTAVSTKSVTSHTHELSALATVFYLRFYEQIFLSVLMSYKQYLPCVVIIITKNTIIQNSLPHSTHDHP